MPRRADDSYDTHPSVALACVRWLAKEEGHTAPARILDPTAGAGPFVRAARACWPDAKIAAVDIRGDVQAEAHAAGADLSLTADALQIPADLVGMADLIVTNPPFCIADQLLLHLYPSMREGARLAFLLSVTWLGSKERWENPSGPLVACPLAKLAPIVPRPSFGMKSGPKFECGLFVWVKGHTGPAHVVEPIRWAPPKRSRKGAKEVGT